MNLEDKRETLFGVLHHVLSVSCRKFDYEKASNSDRLAWGRLIVSATQAYGKLLETVEIEELLERVERLEKAQGQRTPIFP